MLAKKNALNPPPKNRMNNLVLEKPFYVLQIDKGDIIERATL